MFTSDSLASRRDFLKLGAISAGAMTFLPRALWANYESAATEQGNDVVLRCCVMSDVHFNGDPRSKETERFQRAIRFMYEYSAAQEYKNFDALVVVGDMSNHGTENEIGLFKKTMDAELKPGTDAFLCMGNHEFWGGSRELWQSVFGVESNRHYDRNGYRFIAVSPEKGTMKDGDYLYIVDWLERELKEATALYPDKPIFVFQHYPVSPTVYGGRGHDDWGAEDLFDTLQSYPNVVNFSGHTHYPINDPRCAWQGCFSAFGTGTLSYVCHGHEGKSFQRYLSKDAAYAQFYVMEVRRDHSVTLKPYDLTTNSFFNLAYVVAKPGAIEEYVYTDKRYSSSAKPIWRDNTNVTYDLSDPYYVAIEFKQAFCEDVVLGYRVELEKWNEKNNAWERDEDRVFWSYYFERDMPEKARGELDNLEPNTSYRGKVFALNPFMRESDESIEISFKTVNDLNDPSDRNAPYPRANFYDLRVENGRLVNVPSADWTKDREWKTYGSPKIVKDEELGKEVLVFSGKDLYKSNNTDDDYKKLSRATIGAKFYVDKSGAGNKCVFSNTQYGGIGLSYSTKSQAMQLWVCVNGKYTTLEAPIPLEKYVSAYGVYDGRNVTFYIDGKEVARAEARGRITYTSDSTAKAFCLGSDVGANNTNESLFLGKIVYAKLFTWALSAEQVANLSKE